MRILLSLTYYRPYVSGLTIYVERLGRALAAKGHSVTILTSQHEPSLARDEIVDGVRVVRVPVAMRVSKGVIMPGIGYWATKLARENDVLSLHLPEFDATGIALRGRLFRKPTILTYHCDLQLPPGHFNRAVDATVYGANFVAATIANRIVAYTRDYADHSRLLRRFADKIAIIPPPVVMEAPSPEAIDSFRQAHDLAGRQVLGFAARFAAEKGIEYLIDGMPELIRRFPSVKVLFAGPYMNVLGEEEYWQRLSPKIAALGEHWEFVGTLDERALSSFYGSLDTLLVTSVNSTESFGLVQVEAMLCGTPVVACNLPGVRQPVLMTGMGEIVPVADTAGLVQGIERVLTDRARYVRPRSDIEELFDLDVTVCAYLRLFEEEIAKMKKSA